MQRGVLIAVMTLVLVGALAMVAQSKENATEPLACDDLCERLEGTGAAYGLCLQLCGDLTGPQSCKQLCVRAGYEPGTKEHGTCESICVEVSHGGQPNTVGLCKILKAVGMLPQESSVAHCLDQTSPE